MVSNLSRPNWLAGRFVPLGVGLSLFFGGVALGFVLDEESSPERSSPARAEVPHVIGLRADDATTRMERVGFDDIELREVDSDEPATIVTDQSPEGGREVSVNSKITLTISGG